MKLYACLEVFEYNNAAININSASDVVFVVL